MNIFVTLLLLLPSILLADETCSRTATINYQKILVDAGSNNKGEGLRFYLEKDPVSKSLLNKYQKKNKPSLFTAASSTIGSLLILNGLIQSNSTNQKQNSESLLYSGSLLVALSYLTSKTFQYTNESILKEAVDQYNKRNSPKIYFSPFGDNEGNSGARFGLQQEF